MSARAPRARARADYFPVCFWAPFGCRENGAAPRQTVASIYDWDRIGLCKNAHLLKKQMHSVFHWIS